GGTAYVSLTSPNLNLPESASSFEIYLTDSSANLLFSNTELKSTRDRKAVTELTASIIKDHVTSGARKWSSERDDYLVAYQRLSFKELTVVGMVPEGVAYAAVGSLVLRSLVLGFSILMIATGVALVFSKRMTEGLRLIAAVTEKVSQGSFAFRVDTRGLINDEIGALASSFNAMAERIDELMTEVEVRVTSANNKEANTAVHGNLLPDRPYMHANFNLCGSSIFAEQCAGDWWHYEQIGDYVLTFVGKVEARGLPAAMMTAAVHGAVTTYAATMRSMPRAVPQLQSLVNTLNTAVYQSGRGKLKMACFVGMFDLQSGNFHLANVGMQQPFLHRIPFGGRPEKDAERFSLLGKNRHPLLGAGDFIQVKPETVQLKPGDMIIWNTPGMTKSLNVKGQHLDTPDLYKILSKLYDEYEAQSNKVAAGVTAKVTEFLGDIAKTPPDDITAVILAVPKKAYFMERSNEASASSTNTEAKAA
ncbi:MAG: PP2C family protein-serine/threonine phosphatase, partial [Bdellovibrionota bacterium]